MLAGENLDGKGRCSNMGCELVAPGSGYENADDVDGDSEICEP